MGKFPSPGFVLCASVWHGVAAQNEGDPRREMEKSFCSRSSPRTPASGPRAHLPSAPNLQDLFQLLLCVNHDDVGAAIVGDVLAGLRGAGGVDAGDNAAAGGTRGSHVNQRRRPRPPPTRNPAPGRGRPQTDGGGQGSGGSRGCRGVLRGPLGGDGAGRAWGALRREIHPLSPLPSSDPPDTAPHPSHSPGKHRPHRGEEPLWGVEAQDGHAVRLLQAELRDRGRQAGSAGTGGVSPSPAGRLPDRRDRPPGARTG